MITQSSVDHIIDTTIMGIVRELNELADKIMRKEIPDIGAEKTLRIITSSLTAQVDKGKVIDVDQV